jgi:hypothetical protein
VTKAVGRNEPCSCGSGKKYKKCCLASATPPVTRSAARHLTLDPSALPIDFKRVTFDVQARELTFTLPDDHLFTVEIGTAGASDHPPADRPVVYLDQRDWIALARHEWAPEKLTEDQRAAAGTLIALARQKRIILPLSAAHLTETVSNDGHRRRHLAGTLLELSRGWILRNPVRVRHEEIRAAILGQPPVASGVVTLQPWWLFTQDISHAAVPPGALPGWEDLYPRLTAVSAIYSTLIANEKLDLTDGLLRADAWAASHQELSAFLRDDRASRERRELAAHARLLADLMTEIAHAASQTGIPPERFQSWLQSSSQTSIKAMPYLGRLEQLLIHRLANADDKWERNDLNDMNFLACAAGYADVVVGEKKMVFYLRRAAQALGARAVVCRTLAEAVAHLTETPSDGASTHGLVGTPR